MVFIQKNDELINLALVKKIKIFDNKIIFFFNLATEDYTEFEFENNEKAKEYFNTEIKPLLF